MNETVSIKVDLSIYEKLRKSLIKKNQDIRKGDLKEAVSDALEKYIAEELQECGFLGKKKRPTLRLVDLSDPDTEKKKTIIFDIAKTLTDDELKEVIEFFQKSLSGEAVAEC